MKRYLVTIHIESGISASSEEIALQHAWEDFIQALKLKGYDWFRKDTKVEEIR